ncbi:hypothetical protein [Pelotomaculum sp. FP]|uniref:hypothetical protein n=1 Tax=Pelotomaculum sp. FP TaxID=261474 RepID=UPI0012922934|nr:hypothetical protein [Pelotomaculum sp. FP]
MKKLVAPRRERGLKQRRVKYLQPSGVVAPRAGAWIETIMVCSPKRAIKSHPLRGAWIETKLLPTAVP